MGLTHRVRRLGDDDPDPRPRGGGRKRDREPELTHGREHEGWRATARNPESNTRLLPDGMKVYPCTRGGRTQPRLGAERRARGGGRESWASAWPSMRTWRQPITDLLSQTERRVRAVGTTVSNRARRFVTTETRRCSLHRCKASDDGADTCSILRKGRARMCPARGILYKGAGRSCHG